MEELLISNAEMNRDLRSIKDDDDDDEGTTPRSLSSSTNDEAPKSKCLIHHSLNPGNSVVGIDRRDGHIKYDSRSDTVVVIVGVVSRDDINIEYLILLSLIFYQHYENILYDLT